MKTQKIKRYRLSVRRTFPEGHPRAGQPTYFVEKIENALFEQIIANLFSSEIINSTDIKLHTIRANYEYWKNITEQVQRGEAIIEVFYWSGSPYNSKRDGSKQVVFATLDKDSGCGVQKLEFQGNDFNYPSVCHTRNPLNHMFKPLQRDLAKNDGLSLEDFKAWFKGYDMSKPMAIIHFTGFRY